MGLWPARSRLDTALAVVIALGLAFVILRARPASSARRDATWQLVWRGPSGERYDVDTARMSVNDDSVSVVAWETAPLPSTSWRFPSMTYALSRDAFVVHCRSHYIDGSRTSSVWRSMQRLYDEPTIVFSGPEVAGTPRSAAAQYACSHRAHGHAV